MKTKPMCLGPKTVTLLLASILLLGCSVVRGEIRVMTSGGFTAPRSYAPKDGEAPGQLYHLGRDPAESENIYLEQPEVVAELEGLLATLKASGRSRPRRTLR